MRHARYLAIRIAKGGNYYAPKAYTRNVKHGDENFSGVPEVMEPLSSAIDVIDPTSAFQKPTQDRYALIHEKERRVLD